MKRGIVLLALLLAAGTLSAQRNDIAVTVDGPERVVRGTTIEWSATFTNHGPGLAEGIGIEVAFNFERCFAEGDLTLAAGASKTVTCTNTVPLETPPYIVTLTGSVGYGNDADYSNNGVYRYVPYVSKPDLLLHIFNPGVPVPGLPIMLELLVNATAYAVAEDTRLTIDVPAANALATPLPGCTVTGTRVTCDLGDLPGPTPDNSYHRVRIPLEVVAPEGSDVAFDVTAEITSPSGDETPENNRATLALRNYRTFYVTSTDDGGAGSLREAIHAANSACDGATPCLIAFRIEGAGAFASIAPRTSLPVVRAGNVIIDGQTQHRYTGRTGELPRPLVELRGSALREGNGLTITTPCGLHLRGLAINGFPGHGVHVGNPTPCSPTTYGGGGRIIEANYIGTDITGRLAVPNHRGIYMDGSINPTIRDNVISGNTRAGIFIAWGGNNVIWRNVIGLTADGTAALGNGASGVYISPDASGTDAYDNHIAFNGDAGVSIGRGAEWVNVYRNAIHANRQLAVDYGLDGPTLDAPLPAPEVTLAHYDARSNSTTIALSSPPSVPSAFYMHLYANDAPDPGGYGEAQYYLGEARYNPAERRFELVYPGDLRGKWIAAQLIQYLITGFAKEPQPDAIGSFASSASSEIGRAVEVTQ